MKGLCTFLSVVITLTIVSCGFGNPIGRFSATYTENVDGSGDSKDISDNVYEGQAWECPLTKRVQVGTYMVMQPVKVGKVTIMQPRYYPQYETYHLLKDSCKLQDLDTH